MKKASKKTESPKPKKTAKVTKTQPDTASRQSADVENETGDRPEHKPTNG